MSGPRTKAGQRLDLAWPGAFIDRLTWHQRIAAIEAEARTKALDEVRAAVEQEVANVESCPHCSDHATARLRWVLAIIDKTQGAAVSGPVMDFPAAWEYVRTTDSTDHHDQCSWRSTGGALLCDCIVLNDEYKRREARNEQGRRTRMNRQQARAALAADPQPSDTPARIDSIERYARHDPEVEWPSDKYENPETAICAALDDVRERRVHNHGPDEGRGTSCPESLVGACILPSDTPADGLDAAWREAEAALPNDLDIRLTRRAAGGYTVELVTPEFRDGAFVRGEATPVEAFRAALALTQEPRSGRRPDER